VSIGAASRAVDEYCHRRFYLDETSNTRTYIPTWSQVQIDDLVTQDSVSVSGSTVVEGTDYVMLPFNAPLDVRPYEKIQFLGTLSLGLPSVTVEGVFGWPAVPAGVVAATTIIATRLLRRQREAPFGIVTVGIEQGAVARIAQSDPDVQKALCDYVKEQVMIA